MLQLIASYEPKIQIVPMLTNGFEAPYKTKIVNCFLLSSVLSFNRCYVFV